MQRNHKKMKHTLIAFVLILILAPAKTNAQELKPGFDKAEYIDLLKINQKAHIALDKWIDDAAVPAPETLLLLTHLRALKQS